MEQFFVLTATNLGPVETYKVYIQLKEKFDAVQRQYFINKGYKGYRFFLENDFKVLDASIKGC